ncbi:MAG: hypothetical protein HY903_14010 [Deltaproteobacteria bacterium]|nr:hypothetical protein [Deltaproteobacteria bacterium]
MKGLVVILLLLAPAASTAATLGGNVGVTYGDSYRLQSGAAASRTNSFGQQYSVAGSISPWGDDIGTLSMGGVYAWNGGWYDDGRTRRHVLLFDNQLRLVPRGVVPLNLVASRQWMEAATDTLDNETVGTGTVTNLGSTALLRLRGLPAASLSLSHSINEFADAFGSTSTTRQTSGIASINQAIGRTHYGVTAGMTRSTGNVAGSSHDSQRLRVTQSSDLTDRLRFEAMGNLRRRMATRDETGNPDLLNNDTNLRLLAKHSEHWSSHYGYAYSHAARQRLGADDLDTSRQSMSASGSFTFDRPLSLTTGIGVSQSTYHTPAETVRAWSESLSSSVAAWANDEEVSANGSLGGNLGLSQPSTGESGVRYGVNGGAGVSTNLSEWSNGSLGANASWDEDLSAVRSQSSSVTTSGAWTTSALRHARLGLITSLSYGTQLSRFERRSRTLAANLMVKLDWRRRMNALLTAGYRDGTSRYVTTDDMGAALPAAYNVKAWQASLAAGFSPLARLGLSLRFSGSRVGRADTYGTAAAASLGVEYRLGLFALSIREEVHRDWANNRVRTSNRVFATLSRSIDLSPLVAGW